jgi:hypothetical protein
VPEYLEVGTETTISFKIRQHGETVVWDREPSVVLPTRRLCEVRNNPAEVLAGGDPQLEAAVAEALRLIETEGIELMAEPEAPVRYRRPGGGRR